MKKEEQREINLECNHEFTKAIAEIDAATKEKKLLFCSASVLETEHYYILKSYNTLVACINKATDTCYDVLRVVYGYTATSAKHVAKFDAGRAFGGYGGEKWGCRKRLTAREV